MIVRVQSAELSGAQRFVRRLLTEGGPGAGPINGVALFGSALPRSRRRSPQIMDLLVWTPNTCTVVVLADFGSVQHGVLTTGPTGRWLVGDDTADLRTGKSTPNPVLRGRKQRNELAALFRRHGLPDRIDVLVVLIPKTGSRIEWAPLPPEDGVETILVRIGRAAGLAEYFARSSAAGEVHWRAPDIVAAFGILGASRHLPELGPLTDEGFVPTPGGIVTTHTAGYPGLADSSEDPHRRVVKSGLSAPVLGARIGGAAPAQQERWTRAALRDPYVTRPAGSAERGVPEESSMAATGSDRITGLSDGWIEQPGREDGSNESESTAGSGRIAAWSPLRGLFGTGDIGRRWVSSRSGLDGTGSPNVESAPGKPIADEPLSRVPGGPRTDWNTGGDVPGRSRSTGSARWDSAPASPDSERGRRIADGVSTGSRRGIAAALAIPARARRAVAGPGTTARPPRSAHPRGTLARHGRDLRHPAILGLAGLVLAAVAATVFAGSGFARFDVAEYGALCAGGEGNPAAASYSTVGPSPVYLGGELPEYTAFGPSAVWRPMDPGAVQLVACVARERRGELERTCQYPPGPGQPVGRTLNLFTAIYRLSLYEARTGHRVAAIEITGDQYGVDSGVADPDLCRAATDAPEDGLPGRRHSRPSHHQIEQALTPFVAPASPRIRAAR